MSHYFLAAGFVLSCLGFLFFLSFFCELLPLPMLEAPWSGRFVGCESGQPFNRQNRQLYSVSSAASTWYFLP